jgi:hypothetical protein
MVDPTGQDAALKAADDMWTKTMAVVFLGAAGFAAIGRFQGWPGQAWTESLWVALCLGVTVVWLQRNVPLQNVLLAMATLASLALVAVLAIEAGKPGSYLSLGLASTQAPPLRKYMQAVAWTLLLLNAQGVARLIATQKEKSPFYGFWIIGLASALACGFQVGLEAAVNPASNETWVLKAAMVLGWYCAALICLALASPALLKRKPGPRIVSVEPAWVWIGLNLLALATAANRGLWTVVAFQGAVTVLGAWPGWRARGIR